MAKRAWDSLIFGLILLCLGILFLIHNFGYRINVWDIIGKYWPVLLVILGLKYVISGIRKK
ncbi:MAG: LiaI-LiaF-like domain-containing protein [Candidatus Aminicenantia bacterium]